MYLISINKWKQWSSLILWQILHLITEYSCYGKRLKENVKNILIEYSLPSTAPRRKEITHKTLHPFSWLHILLITKDMHLKKQYSNRMFWFITHSRMLRILLVTVLHYLLIKKASIYTWAEWAQITENVEPNSNAVWRAILKVYEITIFIYKFAIFWINFRNFFTFLFTIWKSGK